MTVVIKAENLCKTYKIYNKRLDRLKETFLPFKKQYHTPFSALDNVNIEVNKGDTVGIVGRNGSGKSTLLQIICGILQPTAGSIKVKGRISALLELGAGFNPEFTGLENIYLNAAILGMQKDDIDDCLDDILSFADIGQFVKQPVKTYSSGMYVRLAFAVAINVKPDILIVDEALSVGDTLFQAKCFGKFREFQNNGTTILFVTHSTDLISRYCNSAILLDMGKMRMQDSAKEVVDTYNRLVVGYDSSQAKGLNVNNEKRKTKDDSLDDIYSSNSEHRYGNRKVEILEFGIKNHNNEGVNNIRRGANSVFWVKLRINEFVVDPIVAYTIKDPKGLEIAGTNTYFQKMSIGEMKPGKTILVEFKQVMSLNPGGYLLSFGAAGFEDAEYVVYDRRFDVITFNVESDVQSVGIVDLNSQIGIEEASDKDISI